MESFPFYVGGKLLRFGKGKAWRELKAWIIAPPRDTDLVSLPAVSEPFLAWTISGVVEFQEREGRQPWVSHRIQKGTFFLTYGGAPYDCRWKSLSDEPFVSMAVFLELPLLERAFQEVFGADAGNARLRDISAFTDDALNSLMERLREELLRRKASPLFVQGLGYAIAIHLARNYSELVAKPHPDSPSLPGYRVRQITQWMAEHMTQEFSLDQLAVQAGLSKFHFLRLFKSAVGVSPLNYQINLRIEESKRLLRETKQSVLAIAVDVGYANASHFAQIFRRETGLSPRDYRRRH